MKPVKHIGLIVCLLGTLMAPALAETTTKDEDKASDGFMSRLARAAEEAETGDADKSDAAADKKDEKKSSDDKKKTDDKDSKKADTKKDDKETSLSRLIKSADSKTKSRASTKVLLMPIQGTIEERGEEFSLFSKQPESLKQYIDTLRRARLDDSIRQVVIRVGPNNMGMAIVQELSEAFAELQNKKKTVTVILEDDSQASYLLATAADEIVMPPSAELMLHGVSADSYFLRQLLAKVGVNVQIIHIGQYKSYGETFTHDDFTTPARQNMQEIVDNMYDQVKQTLVKGRELDAEKAEEILNAGPIQATRARELGLIDRVAYEDEILAALKKDDLEIVESSDYKSSTKSSKSDDLSLLTLLSMMSKDDDSADSDLPRVAVLYAVGPITLGTNGGSGLGSDSEIASEDFIDELEKIKDDDEIKAVILRVNSPGGSAFASDLIWKKIEELKKEKPVIASMSGVAASGGYYISMGAHKIIAQPGTLTGSIGVVGGKPNVKQLYDKIGVSKSTISRGRYANLFSETENFDSEQHVLIEGMMKRTYDEFVTKAAEGRKKSYEDIHEVAQGRVWTGEQAHGVGLVDALGGLDTAIVETKTLIGLKSDDKVRLVTYPKQKSLVDILQKAFGSSSSTVRAPGSGGSNMLLNALMAQTPVAPGLTKALHEALGISQMLGQENVLAIMPFSIDVR